MKNLKDKLALVRDEHAEETLNTIIEAKSGEKRDRALRLLGGFTVTNRLAQALSAELMRALIIFQEEKMYESLGYENFVEFLNESDYAPMTKNQFYDRKALLEKEGDITFDLLNALSISNQKRKLLGAGNIQLDGENIIIVDPSTKEEISFNANDRSRILETITALADANADKSKKLDRGQEDNDRLKRKITDLETVIETERMSPAEERDEIENCYILIGSMMKRLNTLLDDATLVRVGQFEGKCLRVLAAQYQQLNDVIAKKLPGAALGSDSEEDRLASLLDDED